MRTITLLTLYHLDRDNPHTSEDLLLQGLGFEGVCQTTGHFKHFGGVGFVPQAKCVPVRMVLNRKQSTLFPSLFLLPPPHTHPQTGDVFKFSWMKDTGKIYEKTGIPSFNYLKHTFYFQSDVNYHTSLWDYWTLIYAIL